jgi:hypothetical protein
MYGYRYSKFEGISGPYRYCSIPLQGFYLCCHVYITDSALIYITGMVVKVSNTGTVCLFVLHSSYFLAGQRCHAISKGTQSLKYLAAQKQSVTKRCTGY